MKKIMILPVIGCLSFSGCGGDASSDLMTDVKQTSYLMIKGEGIDEEIDIVQDKTTFDLGANGNEPLSYIFLNLNQNNPPLIGGISYSSKENKTSLDFFAYEKNGEIWGLSCFPLSICTSNSTLKIEEKGSDNLVNVQFNGANNNLVKNFIVNGGDPSKLIPVKVFGNIFYLAPSSWPVFQKNRFPKLDISGKTLFDDEEYLLENIEKTKSIIEGKKLTFYHFTFNNKKIVMYVQVDESENKSEYGNVFISILDDSGVYRVEHALPNSILQEFENKIVMNISALKLINQNDQSEKILNSNVIIPINESKLTINFRLADVQYINNKDSASAINDQKKYHLNFNTGEKNYYISVVQELKGHVSLEYKLDGKLYKCGDQNNICKGLTTDIKKQNFTFNSVKLGSNILNGTLYITGVLE